MTRLSQGEYFDELVQRTASYQSSADYLETLRVVAALKDFSPFNAYLLRLQRPNLRFAARLERWHYEFGRQLRQDRPAYPLVILRPFGPVDFVFDYDDTDGYPLPLSVLEPYRASGYISRETWERLFHNARRRGVLVEFRGGEFGEAGSIGLFSTPFQLPKAATRSVREEPPVRFRVSLSSLSREVQFTTLLHELGHLCCGHLGGLPGDDWPNRERLPPTVVEFEAESVSFIVGRRLGLESNAEEYLAGYAARGEVVPQGVSVHTVLKAAGLIEEWASKLTFPRKPRREKAERQLRSKREGLLAGDNL
ncbi:hypothetical protein [Deinococcus radiophilus]|uniref:ImmA/IrrE family metallo-endopeptidase n=1 Tax=Deinococcus radiophilus TaxID=32062 RepID=A0A431VW77_9DEIO|nr:hypothetical protein [Deinococcus radiophilus]RTR27484.1 hypothetical protein EJ104_06375 [Deinococcus radiophilus]UFA50348.1 hypothetical protein LMT64_00010 [Deinococcus radiophilus]